METQRRIFQSNIIVSPGASLSALRDAAIADPEGFVRKIEGFVERKEFSLRDVKDFKALYRATADVRVKIQMPDMSGAVREVSASAFPIIMGTLSIAGVNEAYQSVEMVSDQLVTDMEDNKKISTVVQINTLDKDGIDEVKAGKDFPEIGASEESVEIRHRLNGRKLTLLADALEENDVTGFNDKVNGLGEIAAYSNEEQTLKRVTDHYGSGSTPAAPYVYYPAGTATALYSATANTPGTRAPLGNRINTNPLVDDSDLDAARVRLAGMKNESGKRIIIPWSQVQYLGPYALSGTVSKIFNSEYVPGVEGELSNYGPKGKWTLPKERIVTSNLLDDLSASAWYLGAFKKQFRRKWKLRFEYVTLGMDTQAYLNSRVAFQARLAWDMEIGATDYVYVIQNLSGTTAPVNES